MIATCRPPARAVEDVRWDDKRRPPQVVVAVVAGLEPDDSVPVEPRCEHRLAPQFLQSYDADVWRQDLVEQVAEALRVDAHAHRVPCDDPAHFRCAGGSNRSAGLSHRATTREQTRVQLLACISSKKSFLRHSVTSALLRSATRLPLTQTMPRFTSCWIFFAGSSCKSSRAASKANSTGRLRAASSRVRSMLNQCPCHCGCESRKAQASVQSLKTVFMIRWRGLGRRCGRTRRPIWPGSTSTSLSSSSRLCPPPRRRRPQPSSFVRPAPSKTELLHHQSAADLPRGSAGAP